MRTSPQLAGRYGLFIVGQRQASSRLPLAPNATQARNNGPYRRRNIPFKIDRPSHNQTGTKRDKYNRERVRRNN